MKTPNRLTDLCRLALRIAHDNRTDDFVRALEGMDPHEAAYFAMGVASYLPDDYELHYRLALMDAIRERLKLK
jgi:hypothetical protein